MAGRRSPYGGSPHTAYDDERFFRQRTADGYDRRPPERASELHGSASLPRNELYRNIDRDLLGHREEHLQGRIPPQERQTEQGYDYERSYALYPMPESDYYTDGYRPPPPRPHEYDQYFSSFLAPKYHHSAYEREYPAPQPSYHSPQPTGVGGSNLEEDVIQRLSDLLIREGLKVQGNSLRDSSRRSENSRRSPVARSRHGQDESKRNTNMKRDPRPYIDCFYFYSERGCYKRRCEYRHAEEAKDATEECELYHQNKCRNLCCNKRHTRNLQSKPKSDDIIVCPIEKSRGFCDDPLCKNAHKQKRIDKNPQDEIWCYVCQERDAKTRNVVKLSVQNTYVKELLSMDLNILETSTPIPAFFSEICTSYVEDDCNDTHCPYYHSKTTFAWQVAESHHLWINLTEMQNKELELAYCNPSNVHHTVEVLDKSNHQDGDPLLKILGLDSWMACFDDGRMKKVAGGGNEIRLRRLSTPSIVTSQSDAATLWIWYFEDDGNVWKEIRKIDRTSKRGSEVLEKLFSDLKHNDHLSIAGRRYIVDLTKMTQKNVATGRTRNLRRRPEYREATKMVWSFKDDHGAWIPYGQTNEMGYQSNITSSDLEAYYQLNNSGSMMFTSKNSRKTFKYIIDFANMTQTNLKTKKVRQLNRVLNSRHSEYTRKQSKQTSDMPSTWDDMGDTMKKLIPLDSSGKEYQEMEQFFNQTATVSRVIVKIYRIQNLLQYGNFCNRKKAMMLQYNNDEAQVNEMRLFHGTKPDVVMKICNENFNWRYAGTSSGSSYGMGTYFSNRSQRSMGYCLPDAAGICYIFTARVLVGRTTVGNSSMVMPPCDSNNVMYDTTVNNQTTPSIFVKYYEDTYYPEYLIRFK